MPVGVLTTDYIDVWCNSATDTPHKIRVGDMIAVKWNADARDREYTWCTVLATTHVASGAELTLMHEQAVDVPGHPGGEPTHVTYSRLGWQRLLAAPSRIRAQRVLRHRVHAALRLLPRERPGRGLVCPRLRLGRQPCLRVICWERGAYQPS